MNEEDSRLISKNEVDGSTGLRMQKLASVIGDQRRLLDTVSLGDLVSSEATGKEEAAGFGRSDVLPVSELSMMASGILPMSKALFNDRVRRLKMNELTRTLRINNITAASTHGYRTRLCYRLVRYLARIVGEISGFDMLYHSIAGNDWHMPRVFSPVHGYSIGAKGVRAILQEWSTSNITFSFFDGKDFNTVKGFSYLPPHIPDQDYIKAGCRSYEEVWNMRISRKMPEGYKPEEDKALDYFCSTMELLIETLSAWIGTEKEPECGLYGIAGLLSSNTCRILWPTRDELIAYEDMLCSYIYDMVTAHNSPQKCEKLIMEEFGVTRNEAIDYTRMAMDWGTSLYKSDNEKFRIMQQGRLAELADFTKKDDFRCSLAAMKEINSIAGLKKSSGDKEVQELRDIGSRAGELAESDDFEIEM